MIRSILAVLAGMVVWFVLWMGLNAGLAAAYPDRFDAAGVTADATLLGAFLLGSLVASLLAGWTTARLAVRAPVKHALVLGAIHLAIGIAVQASVWSQMPLWYHLPFLALVVPAHWAGGVVGARSGGAIRSRPMVA